MHHDIKVRRLVRASFGVLHGNGVSPGRHACGDEVADAGHESLPLLIEGKRVLIEPPTKGHALLPQGDEGAEAQLKLQGGLEFRHAERL